MEEAPPQPHPPDCPCCRVVIDRRGPKRTREDADLSTFLPEAEGEAEGEDEQEGEGEEQPEWQEEEEDALLINDALFKSFETHVERLDAARLRRIETLSFKSALEDDGKEEVNEDATLDEIEGLGVWMPGDEFQGDVNMRTLQRLLTRVDQRGFERSSQQLEFHVAFMKAAARVIYRGSWETERPAIMKRYGWETSNSEVLISTPRRFGVRAYRAPARRPHASHVWRCLRGRKPSASPSSVRASRSLSGSRWLSSAQLDVRPENCSSASSSNANAAQTPWSHTGAHGHPSLAGLCDWPVARSASASTTRRAAPRPQSAPRPLTPRGACAGGVPFKCLRRSQEPHPIVPE